MTTATDTAEPRAALDDVARDAARRPLLVAPRLRRHARPARRRPGHVAPRCPPRSTRCARSPQAPDVTLALVSGRSLVDLHRRAEVPVGTVLIGSHGGERGRAGEHGLVHDPMQLTDEQDALLVQVGSGPAARRPRARRRLGPAQAGGRRPAHAHGRARGRRGRHPRRRRGREGLGLHAAARQGRRRGADPEVTKGEALLRLRDDLGAATRPLRRRRHHRRARLRRPRRRRRHDQGGRGGHRRALPRAGPGGPRRGARGVRRGARPLRPVGRM